MFWRRFWGHEFADGVEDDLELPVVFLFERVEFFGEVGLGRQYPAQADEGPHDGDVDLYGAGAVEDARQHGDALFGEGVGGVSAAAPFT